MRTQLAVVAVAASALGLVPVVHAATTDSVVGTPDATVGPLISGTASYVSGTYAWTDYAYDDTGADTGGSPGGDAAYATELEAGNAADLVQLQLSLTKSGDLHVRAVLETLLDERVPVLRVGFDTDGDVTTGASSMPTGGWITEAPLGLDRVVTVSGAGGELLTWDATGWSAPMAVPAAVDAVTNTLETTVPAKRLLDRRRRQPSVVRTVAAVGVFGDDAIYDLAFLHAEDVCTMPSDAPAVCVPNADNQMGQDQHQADVLAGQRPAASAVATIDLAKLRNAVTELARIDGRGYYSLLYHSDLALGEGIRSSGAATRSTVLPHGIFAGAYQPYVVRLPHAFTQPLPAIVYLHGRSGNHLQAFVNNFAGYDPDAMVVGVLGRGYDVGYGGIDWLGFVEPEGAYGEQDVLDVYADLLARGVLDPEHVVVGGISMGGVGSFHLAELHPDLFTGVLPIVGGDAGILPPNWGPGLIENLSNMRLRMANGAIDPLAHLGSQLTPVALQGLGTVDFRAWEALRRHHEWQAGLVDCVFDELLTLPRVVDPARVIYSVNPAFEVSVPATGLHVAHTSAYWVSGIVPRPDSLDRSATSPATSRVDVTTLARAVRTVAGTPVAAVGENFSSGADYCGPNPAVHANDAWEMNGLSLAPGARQSTSNGMAVTIAGVEALTLDLPRMSISVGAPLGINVTGDGPGSITLRGPWPEGASVDITRDRMPHDTLTVVDGAITLSDDFLGRRDYELTVAT